METPPSTLVARLGSAPAALASHSATPIYIETMTQLGGSNVYVDRKVTNIMNIPGPSTALPSPQDCISKKAIIPADSDDPPFGPTQGAFLHDVFTCLTSEVTSESKLLWIQGPTGSGKTTIMQAVAHRLQQQGYHVASFVGIDETSTPLSTFITTLSSQLPGCAFEPAAQSLPAADFATQTNRLIINPWVESLNDSPEHTTQVPARRSVILVDNIEKCAPSDTEREGVLLSLSKIAQRMYPTARVALSTGSDPKAWMKTCPVNGRLFDDLGHLRSTTILPVPQDDAATAEVSSYLKGRLERKASQLPFDPAEIPAVLFHAIGPNFRLADGVVQYYTTPAETPGLLESLPRDMESALKTKALRGLDSTYKQALLTCPRRDQVLKLLSCMLLHWSQQRPLPSLEALESSCGYRVGHVVTLLAPLEVAGILRLPATRAKTSEPIQVNHPSFFEFLREASRSPGCDRVRQCHDSQQPSPTATKGPLKSHSKPFFSPTRQEGPRVIVELIKSRHAGQPIEDTVNPVTGLEELDMGFSIWSNRWNAGTLFEIGDVGYLNKAEEFIKLFNVFQPPGAGGTFPVGVQPLQRPPIKQTTEPHGTWSWSPSGEHLRSMLFLSGNALLARESSGASQSDPTKTKPVTIHRREDDASRPGAALLLSTNPDFPYIQESFLFGAGETALRTYLEENAEEWLSQYNPPTGALICVTLTFSSSKWSLLTFPGGGRDLHNPVASTLQKGDSATRQGWPGNWVSRQSGAIKVLNSDLPGGQEGAMTCLTFGAFQITKRSSETFLDRVVRSATQSISWNSSKQTEGSSTGASQSSSRLSSLWKKMKPGKKNDEV